MTSLAFIAVVLLGASMTCGLPADNTSLASNQPLDYYRLPGNEADMCLDHDLFKNTVDCLQILLERYYQLFEDNIMKSCPNLVQLVADNRCWSCPWDRLNSTRMETFDMWRSDKYDLFHDPGEGCLIARHVEIFKWNFEQEKYTHWRLVYRPAIWGTLLLLISPGFLSFNTTGESQAVVFFGVQLSELAVLFWCWLIFNIGSALLALAEDFYKVCETLATNLLISATRIVTYYVMVIVSFQRTLRLKYTGDIREGNEYVRSWSAYFTYLTTNMRGFPRFMTWIIRVLPFATFFILMLTETSDELRYAPDFNECSVGKRDIRHGIFQYGLLVVEFLAIVAYSWGPSSRPRKFWLRFQLLLAIMIVSIAMTIAMFFVERTPSTLIPHIWDHEMTGYIEPVHALIVSFLGLFEPVRMKYAVDYRKFQLDDLFLIQFANLVHFSPILVYRLRHYFCATHPRKLVSFADNQGLQTA